MTTEPLAEQARTDMHTLTGPVYTQVGALCVLDTREPRNQVAANDRDEQRTARLDADRSLHQPPLPRRGAVPRNRVEMRDQYEAFG